MLSRRPARSIMPVGFRQGSLLLPLACALWLWCAPALGEESWGEKEKPCRSQRIQVQGNRFLDSDRILSEIGTEPDSPLTLHRLENSIDRILNLYEENGFPYCQISPSGFRSWGNGEITFSFLVEEGPRVRITEVQLEGLKSTRKKVILREVGGGIFGFFSQRRLEAGLNRIGRLSFIERIDRTQLLAGDNPEEGILRIALRERKNNSFSGMLGYAPGRGAKGGSIFGSVELIFDNIFGTGRRMQWNWSRKDSYSSGLLFAYREPWVLGLPPTLELSLSQTDRDSTFLKLSFGARILFNSTQRVSWGVEAGWEKVVPGPAGECCIPDSRKYKIGAVFGLDLLDRRDNPRKGILYGVEAGYLHKINHPAASLPFGRERVSSVKLTLDLEHFLPSLKAQTVLVGLHLKGLITDERVVPVSDQFELGGRNSIRGYRDDEFFGTTVTWANLEYRFLLEGDSRLLLFTDYGYFERKALARGSRSVERISAWKLGYGFGLRVNSRAGLVAIDYGLAPGQSTTEGMIHFGVSNSF